MNDYDLELNRFKLMIAVCEKHKNRLKAHESRVKEQIIIDNLKKQLTNLINEQGRKATP